MTTLLSFLFSSVLLANNLEITTTITEVETPQEILEQLEKQDRMLSSQPQRTLDFQDGWDNIDLGSIVNLGKEIWKVIEDNQPVLNVKHLYANALPNHIQASRELQGFSKIRAKSFKYEAHNLFGVQVFNVTYTLVYRHGGNLSGKGAYLTNVGIIPSDVSVNWGYTLNMDVINVHVENIGSSENPVAGMSLEIAIDVATVIKKSKFTKVFELAGDSESFNAY
jgi:hypothetical protein